ncbi:unnamed protein product [Paramecium primaurelia]|uniref:Uncharacterized protein n=1 Tax=Paramecium primaurelia TaxID=5886 RepID=A0A8S1JVZ7_PARPR|nr:unnamed protein product [Paramecium primaurelia]
MGSICNQRITSPYKEFDLEEIIFGRTYIYGPPSIIRPSPIEILKFSDEDFNYQQEKEQWYSTQIPQSEDQALLQISDRDLKLTQVKLSVEEVLILKEQPESPDQISFSKDDQNSEIKDSQQDIAKHKPILKHKNQNTSNPQSPKNQLKDSQTSGSQRSIKKVTFDKKSKVVYSSFRKIKY